MNKLERNTMFEKIRKYDTLSLNLKHLKEMKRDLDKGKTLRELNVFGANISNSVYIPEVENFRERLKGVIKIEVDKEILRIEEELKSLQKIVFI